MADAKAWIEERRSIHAAATEGPWYKTPNDRILSESVQWPEGDDYDVAGGFGRDGAVVEAIHDFDGNAIVDAHSNLPRALNALSKVLEQVEFMETDAENQLNAGHLHTSEALLESAGDLRRAIKGEIDQHSVKAPGGDDDLADSRAVRHLRVDHSNSDGHRIPP